MIMTLAHSFPEKKQRRPVISIAAALLVMIQLVVSIIFIQATKSKDIHQLAIGRNPQLDQIKTDAPLDYFLRIIAVEYRIYSDRRCRTDKGKEGNDGYEYTMHEFADTHWELHQCKEYCSSRSFCTGFEYNKNGNCEIWEYESAEFLTVKNDKSMGAYCYWKDYSLLLQPTLTPTTSVLTNDATNKPTHDPTRVPTKTPTNAPTKDPTGIPTHSSSRS